MKRKILMLALCLVISLFGAVAVACNKEEKPLTPTDETVFVINNNGVITDLTSDGKLLDTIVIPQTVQGKEVKEIGASAFKLCTKLKKIVLPETLKTLRMYAFEKCTALREVVIPDSLTRIEHYVFRGCSSLESITLSDNVTVMGDNVFYNCISLKRVRLSANIPKIGKQNFYNCSSLTSITIPSKVGQIEYNAFKGCTKLSSVTIEEGVKGIQYGAFSQCAISQITIPDSVTAVGDGAFERCENLKTVNIGKGLVSVGSKVFAMCPSVKNVSICSENTALKEENGVLYTADGKNLIYFIPQTVVSNFATPEGVETIKSGAFDNSNVRTVTLSNSVLTVENDAFSNCSNLIAVVLPSTLTSLGETAFSSSPRLAILTDASETPASWPTGSMKYCPVIYDYDGEMGETNGLIWAKMKSGVAVALSDKTASEVVIPAKINDMDVTEIPSYAFYNCSAIKKLVIPSSVTVVSNHAVLLCNDIKIYCQASEQPSSWAEKWNTMNSPVTFGYSE